MIIHATAPLCRCLPYSVAAAVSVVAVVHAVGLTQLLEVPPLDAARADQSEGGQRQRDTEERVGSRAVGHADDLTRKADTRCRQSCHTLSRAVTNCQAACGGELSQRAATSCHELVRRLSGLRWSLDLAAAAGGVLDRSSDLRWPGHGDIRWPSSAGVVIRRVFRVL